MKKIVMLLFVSCLFCSVAQASMPAAAALERAVFSAKKTKAQTMIVRDQKIRVCFGFWAKPTRYIRANPRIPMLRTCICPTGIYPPIMPL